MYVSLSSEKVPVTFLSREKRATETDVQKRSTSIPIIGEIAELVGAGATIVGLFLEEKRDRENSDQTERLAQRSADQLERLWKTREIIQGEQHEEIVQNLANLKRAINQLSRTTQRGDELIASAVGMVHQSIHRFTNALENQPFAKTDGIVRSYAQVFLDPTTLTRMARIESKIKSNRRDLLNRFNAPECGTKEDWEGSGWAADGVTDHQKRKCKNAYNYNGSEFLRDFYSLTENWIMQSQRATADRDEVVASSMIYLTMYELLTPIGPQFSEIFSDRMQRFQEESLKIVATLAKPVWQDGLCQSHYGELPDRHCENPCLRDNGGCAGVCLGDGGVVQCLCCSIPGTVLDLDGKSCLADPCITDNGGCSDICRANGGETECACVADRILAGDNKTCKSKCEVNNGGCSEQCDIVDGEAQCSCWHGDYLMPDQKTCSRSCIQFQSDCGYYSGGFVGIEARGKYGDGTEQLIYTKAQQYYHDCKSTDRNSNHDCFPGEVTEVTLKSTSTNGWTCTILVEVNGVPKINNHAVGVDKSTTICSIDRPHYLGPPCRRV